MIALFKSISNKVTFPKSFLIYLYSKLYTYQPRCFPYLQTVLAENLNKTLDKNDKWEVLLAQAAAMKYICENE